MCWLPAPYKLQASAHWHIGILTDHHENNRNLFRPCRLRIEGICSRLVGSQRLGLQGLRDLLNRELRLSRLCTSFGTGRWSRIVLSGNCHLRKRWRYQHNAEQASGYPRSPLLDGRNSPFGTPAQWCQCACHARAIHQYRRSRHDYEGILQYTIRRRTPPTKSGQDTGTLVKQ